MKEGGRAAKVLGPAGIVLLAAFPLFCRSPYQLHVATSIFYTIVLTSSFRLIMNTGQISLAHAAFMGIGAYASALLVKNAGLSFFLAMPLAGLIAAAAAVLIGYPTLRIKGIYFILVTFALIEIFRIVLNNFWRDFFGGPDGILHIPPPALALPVLGKVVFASKASFYYLALGLMAASLLILRRIERSPLGKIFFSIRQADLLVEALGVATMKYKIMAFAVGSFFAGVTGSFYAHYLTNISPINFNFWFSTDILVAIIIGGAGSFAGPIVGAAILTLISEALSAFRNYQTLVLGLAMIGIILFAPQGLMGLYPQLARRWKKNR